jgi:hypothetical protein
LQTEGENAPGLASLERARMVVWTLWKILTDLLVGLGHLLLLYLVWSPRSTVMKMTNTTSIKNLAAQIHFYRKNFKLKHAIL